MKDLGGAYRSSNEGVIKDINGNNIVKEDEKAQRWREHFQSVLNGQRPNDVHVFEEFAGEELQVDVGTTRYGEVSQAISKMKENKSPGEDLITGEMLKATLGDLGVERLHDLLCMVWDS